MAQQLSNFRSIITLQTQTQLHAGVLSGDHIIDRPIHRDVINRNPKVSSNALKGAIKENFDGRDKDLLFGMDEFDLEKIRERNAEGYYKGHPKPGLIFFTDVRVLFFPVKSKAGVWAWITCPRLLKKFRTENRIALDQTGVNNFYQKLENAISENHAIYCGKSLLVQTENLVLHRHRLKVDGRVSVELLKEWQAAMSPLATIPDLEERLVILSDENFDAMTVLYTSAITRNKVDDATGAVAAGALFTEEYLPENTFLYASVYSMPNASHDKVKALLVKDKESRFQLGGNAGLGKRHLQIKLVFSSTLKRNRIMSILTQNRKIALKAYSCFAGVPENKTKDYLNAVQKSMLLLGTQGMKRMLLYITSQMSKDEANITENKKAWDLIYAHLAGLFVEDKSTFQYKMIMTYDKEKIALHEEEVLFFLQCLKRLSNTKITAMKASDENKLSETRP